VAAFAAAAVLIATPAAAQFDCGNAFYDDGTAVEAYYFGGFMAGDPDYMYAVFFDLDDWGFEPYEAEITGLCAGNLIDVGFGAAWPNEIFVYADANGSPDPDQMLAHGTIHTGTGLGQSVVMFDEPVILPGDFWLVSQGHPPFANSDFNMEGDSAADSGHSFLSEGGGFAGLQPSIDGDWLLRAYLQPVERSYLTAGMAHAPGANDSQWRSKLAVLNATGAAATADGMGRPVEVTLTYRYGSEVATETITLAAGELRAWDDVALELFGIADDSAGSVQVTADAPVVVTARTYNMGDVGTFGQFLPGVEMNETMTSGQTGVLSNLSNTDRFRTNIGFINLGEAQVQVRITLYDATGQMLGTRNLNIPPGAWRQQNDIFGAVGAGMMDNAYAEAEVVTNGGKVWGYASVVDDPPGDPTTIPIAIK
jgi:hypothetical protein